MRPQIIKSILIGICITIFGEASFVIDEWFFPFTTLQTAKGIDYLLTLIMAIVFSPSFFVPWKLIGDPTDIPCILLTVFFWASIVFILMKAMKAIKRSRQMPSR